METLLMDKPHVCRFDAALCDSNSNDKDNGAKARFIFAHGAGAGMDHDFMQNVATGLAKRGIEVLRFNFPYMQTMSETGNKRPPNRMPALLEHYQQVVSDFSGDLPLFIGGKSMGGRASTMLVAQEMTEACKSIKGVLVLGYPFHPMGKPEKRRVDHLPDMYCPCLIVQGARDTMGNEQEVASYDLPNQVDVQFLPDGDHSLKPRKASGFNHQQHIDSACDMIAAFIDSNL